MVTHQTKQKISVDEVLVPHKRFDEAYHRVTNQIEASKTYADAIGMALVGESRSGKSRLIEYISQQYPRMDNCEGMVIPLLCIRTPAKPTVKGLVETLLSAIGEPLCFQRGSENEKTERLFSLLKQIKTHTIVIDEFQHFYDKTSHKIQHHLTDWLKIFMDRAGLMIILVGLPTCMGVINQNEQLRGRLLAPVLLHRFDWRNATDRAEFVACLASFADALEGYDLPDMSSDEMAFRFYCATGGLIGYIVKLLQKACLNADIKQDPVIDLECLAIAYEEAVWVDHVMEVPNPFAASIKQSNTERMLEAASNIGVAKDQGYQPMYVMNTVKMTANAASFFS